LAQWPQELQVVHALHVPVGEHVPAKESPGIERQIATRMILGKFMISKVIASPIVGDLFHYPH
jgi:hypothetical protein